MASTLALGQIPKGVINRTWDQRATEILTMMTRAAEEAEGANHVISEPRDREVFQAGRNCALNLFADATVNESFTLSARFRMGAGDSWIFQLPIEGCPRAGVCVVSITDTPHHTTFELLLPRQGKLSHVLERSFKWSSPPIQLANLHIYADAPKLTEAVLLGGVPGSESADGYGMIGVVRSNDTTRLLRVTLGKRHCEQNYTADLYFVSRRFTSLIAEARAMGPEVLLEEARGELRTHNYAFPSSALHILLDELYGRGVTPEVVRELMNSAIWPLDGYSTMRLHALLEHVLKDKIVVDRNAAVVKAQIVALMRVDDRNAVDVVSSILKTFSFREDGSQTEDIARLVITDRRFTRQALRYLESKATSKASVEFLEQARVASEFEAQRQAVLKNLRERMRE